jgi:fumarate reductase flavoprotein subunit
MWDKVGIIRDAAGLAEAERGLAGLDVELERCSLPDASRAFNLTWHDWLNLRSLVAVSRVITAAAIARTDSRGAHFRSDFPQAGSLEGSAFTSLQLEKNALQIRMKPVAFTRVRPGESLLKNAA